MPNFQVPAQAAPQMPQMGAQPASDAPQTPGMGAAASQQQGQGGQNMEVMTQINDYIMGLPPEKQDLIKKAAVTPEFPGAMDALFGPDMGAYFKEVQNQVLAQQNSQAAPQGTPAQPENPAAAQAPVGQPAKATSNIPMMG